MIDQPEGKEEALITALAANPGPFESVQTLPKGSGLFGKRATRRQVFELIRERLTAWSIDRVFTGNDRRIEFQYAQYQLQLANRPVHAIYLEDGVNSYLPFHPSHRGLRAIADPVIEPLLKKIGYGSWYDRSGAVGCSRWVNERQLTFPALLQTQQGPDVVQLPAENYTTGAAAAHIAQLVESMTREAVTFKGDLLLVLPHSNDLLAQYGDAKGFQRAIKPLLDSAGETRVKYHPNENLAVLEDWVAELPRRLPMEMLISQCVCRRIVGDTSAALLSAKWLQPDANVMSVRNSRPGPSRLFELMAQAGVQVIERFDSA